MLVLLACKKHEEPNCYENNKGNISLTPGEKLIHPYGMNDSLVFFNKVSNNRISFCCNNQFYINNTISENDPDNPKYSGCLGNYIKTESYYTQFRQSIDQLISIGVCTKNPFDSNYNENHFHIHLFIPDDSIMGFEGLYSFRQDTIFNFPPIASSVHVDMFYDTITILNNLYHKVYKLEGFHLSNNSERITNILYSLSDGIIRFSTTKNNVWDLEARKILH